MPGGRIIWAPRPFVQSRLSPKSAQDSSGRPCCSSWQTLTQLSFVGCFRCTRPLHSTLAQCAALSAAGKCARRETAFPANSVAPVLHSSASPPVWKVRKLHAGHRGSQRQEAASWRSPPGLWCSATSHVLSLLASGPEIMGLPLCWESGLGRLA